MLMVVGNSEYIAIVYVFYVHVTVHHNKFLYNKTDQMHQFPKFTLAWNFTCFRQFLCPSSGVYSLYTQHWYMSYRFEDSFRAGPLWNQQQNKTSAECTVNKLLILGGGTAWNIWSYLVGFIIKKIGYILFVYFHEFNILVLIFLNCTGWKKST